jgi:hypothetical protein
VEAATGADIIVVLTEWNEFRAVDLAQVRTVMHRNILVDLRNVYRPDAAEAAGLVYYGIGRGRSPDMVNGVSSRQKILSHNQTSNSMTREADLVL